MRNLFRYPQIQAARTASSTKLLNPEALHTMAVAHIQQVLVEQDFSIVFKSNHSTMYPHLKAAKKDGRIWWIIVGVGMYPDLPELPEHVKFQLLNNLPDADAVIYYAPIMFINTKNQNLSLPSQNGTFTPLFNGFIKISKENQD